MIFTHIKTTMLYRNINNTLNGGFYFSWIIDPSLGNGEEYDAETGRYYV
jgi:hypothetical protein